MLHDRVASRGAARKAGMAARSERNRIGTLDAGHAQAIDRFCNDIGISRVVLRYGQRWSVKAFDEAMYAGFRESVEHEAIFGDCGGSRRVSHLIQVRILRAPADRFELVAGQ